ncbi:MAG: DUF58 domain-containing protein [Thermoplasmata archaeon]
MSERWPSARDGWSLRAVLLFAGGGILAAAAVALRDPAPLFAAVPLLVAPLVVALLLPREPLRIRAGWTTDRAGAAPTLELDWSAGPGIDPDDLHWSLPEPRPGRWAPGPLPDPRGSGRSASFRLRLERPTVAAVPLPDFFWEDPIGIYRRTATAEGDPLVLEWYPPTLARAGNLRLHRTVPRPGEVRSRAVGPSGEFYGLREAGPLDGPRQINWRATARLGRPVANDYAVDRTGDVVLLLDLRSTPLGPDGDAQAASVVRAGALALTDLFLRERARVAVAIYREFLEATPLAAGRHQRYRIRELLIAPDPRVPDGPDERCAVSMRRHYPGGVTTILLTPLASPDPRPLVLHLRRRGFPVVILSPSPLALDHDRAGLPEAELALADRLDRLVRRETVATLWGEAPTIDWDRFDSLEPLLEFLRRPALRGPRRA